MGDSDTKVEARKIAFDLAKRLAVEKIGTYIETKTEVVNWQLTKDEITTYTSAIVKATVVSENVRLLEDKTTVFTITIKASVDIGVLDKKIKEIKDDTKRKEQLSSLQAENSRLLKELESISAQLKSDNQSEASSLRKQREVIFEKIDKNQNSMTIAFEKGTLLNLALKNKDALAEEKKYIDEFFQFIADNTKITIGEPQVRNNGNVADLVIDVTFQFIKLDEAVEMMKQFCEDVRGSNMRDFLYMCGLPQKFKGVNGAKLAGYCHKKSLTLHLTAGEISKYDDIAGCGMLWLNRQEHYTFENIPIKELEQIPSIDAKIFVSGP